MSEPDATASHAGLAAAEAARRHARDGPNVLPQPGRHGTGALLREAAREPMFVLLPGAAVLYLLLGEPHEGFALLLMVVLVLGMTLVQQGRTERALQALRALSAPAATVVRDGRRVRIPAADVVAGDLIVLAEGDRVPADALLVEASGMLVDESLLTGESVPVDKFRGEPETPPAPPGGNGLPWVYAGTLVVQGDGLARVRATGARTELGRIGAALHDIRPPEGRLQAETRVLARRFAGLGTAVSVVLVLLLRLRGAPWLDALLAGVALSMSVLPAEFPVILSLLPALGAWRLARRQVLTRRLAAIEILGSTSVLCVDKTGTLTENRMALRLLWRDGVAHDCAGSGTMAPALREVLDLALLASRPPGADPIELALHAAAGSQPQRPGIRRLEREYGLTQARAAIVRIWFEGGRAVAAAKGAPETIAQLCAGAGIEASAPALAAASALARDGLRVLAVAGCHPPPGPWPDDPAALGLRLVGLVALADPLRADIPAAVAECRRAGVRVMMITGDHPETAQAIARAAGLADGAVLTGPALARLDSATLAGALARASVCARIVPAQKLEIVRALQRGGAVVAMTGDGVNDAPALRAADVGVAMGARGTDVAREAAELTLLDDRFAALVEALRAGRRIFSNMRKSVAYVCAIHVPIAMLALLPPLFGWPVLLFPLHIVIMELLIDPACSLAFEAEPDEPGLMRQPPRPRDAALLAPRKLAAALLRGLWAAALAAASYGWALAALPPAQARATAFAALILCNLGLLLSCRQEAGALGALRVANPLFGAIAAGAILLLAGALWWPPLATLLLFAPPPAAWLGAAALTAPVMLIGLHLVTGRAGKQ